MLFGTDSHTCNAGAFGQFASGIGNTDAGFILGTGKLLIKVRSSTEAWHVRPLHALLYSRAPTYLLTTSGCAKLVARGCPESVAMQQGKPQVPLFY